MNKAAAKRERKVENKRETKRREGHLSYMRSLLGMAGIGGMRLLHGQRQGMVVRYLPHQKTIASPDLGILRVVELGQDEMIGFDKEKLSEVIWRPRLGPSS